MSQYNGVLQYKISNLAFSCLQYNNCIAIQFSSLTNLPFLSQYNSCIVTQNQAILTPLSQYNLGSSPTDSAAQKIFVFVFFFSIISSYWKMSQKLYSSFFFSSTPQNKFILHFSLTLHTVKLLEKYFFSSYKFFFSHFQPLENTKKNYIPFFFSFFRIL